jgi:hypothetical protein
MTGESAYRTRGQIINSRSLLCSTTHAAAIEFATKQRINKATIDSVASKLHRQ